jgi:hypothetical protein
MATFRFSGRSPSASTELPGGDRVPARRSQGRRRFAGSAADLGRSRRLPDAGRSVTLLTESGERNEIPERRRDDADVGCESCRRGRRGSRRNALSGSRRRWPRQCRGILEEPPAIRASARARALPMRKIAPFIPGGAAALRGDAHPATGRRGRIRWPRGSLSGARWDRVPNARVGADDELHGFRGRRAAGLEADDELAVSMRTTSFAASTRTSCEASRRRGTSAWKKAGAAGPEQRTSCADLPRAGVTASPPTTSTASQRMIRWTAEQGYVRQDGVNGIDAFVPQRAPATRWFRRPLTRRVGRPLW